MHFLSELLLWLFVINLGISFGAGLYEKVIILPRWFTKFPEIGYRANVNAMREMDTGRKFWGGVNTVPLTLLTIANLIVSMRATGPKYNWWLTACLLVIIERIGTFSYFIPTALKLMRSQNLTEKKASGLISSWLFLNYFRNAFTLIAWIMALEALSL
jgi:hypothetical protein